VRFESLRRSNVKREYLGGVQVLFEKIEVQIKNRKSKSLKFVRKSPLSYEEKKEKSKSKSMLLI
jgi:hypothetical protein